MIKLRLALIASVLTAGLLWLPTRVAADDYRVRGRTATFFGLSSERVEETLRRFKNLETEVLDAVYASPVNEFDFLLNDANTQSRFLIVRRGQDWRCDVDPVASEGGRMSRTYILDTNDGDGVLLIGGRSDAGDHKPFYLLYASSDADRHRPSHECPLLEDLWILGVRPLPPTVVAHLEDELSDSAGVARVEQDLGEGRLLSWEVRMGDEDPVVLTSSVTKSFPDGRVVSSEQHFGDFRRTRLGPVPRRIVKISRGPDHISLTFIILDEVLVGEALASADLDAGVTRRLLPGDRTVNVEDYRQQPGRAVRTDVSGIRTIDDVLSRVDIAGAAGSVPQTPLVTATTGVPSDRMWHPVAVASFFILIVASAAAYAVYRVRHREARGGS